MAKSKAAKAKAAAAKTKAAAEKATAAIAAKAAAASKVKANVIAQLESLNIGYDDKMGVEELTVLLQTAKSALEGDVKGKPKVKQETPARVEEPQAKEVTLLLHIYMDVFGKGGYFF